MAKKKHVGLIVFLVLFNLLIVLPVGLTYALFYEQDNDTLEIDPNFNLETYFGDSMVRSLNETKTSGKMKLLVGESDLNNIIAKVAKDAEVPMDSFGGKAHVKVDGNNYTFIVSAKVPLFSTKLSFYTQVEEGIYNGEDAFLFKIKGAQIGRVGGLTDIALSNADSVASEKQVNTELANSGIHATVSYADRQIVYTKSALISDIPGFLNGASGDQKFFVDTVLDLFEKNIASITLADGIGAAIDFSSFVNNDVLTSSKEDRISLDNARNKTLQLSNEKKITANQFDLMVKFLIQGYQNLESEEQTTIRGIDCSSIGIANVETYTGEYNVKGDFDIGASVASRIDPAAMLATHSISYISETDIDSYLHDTRGIVGTTYLLTDSTNEVINYIAVNDIYTNLYVQEGNGRLDVVSGLSINGYQTNVVFRFRQGDPSSTGIKFIADSLWIGQNQMEDGFVNYVFGVLSSSLESDSMIRANAEEKSISFDFTSMIDGSGYKDQIALIGAPTYQVDGANLAAEGRIDIKIA